LKVSKHSERTGDQNFLQEQISCQFKVIAKLVNLVNSKTCKEEVTNIVDQQKEETYAKID
jgi:hypothetical protein